MLFRTMLFQPKVHDLDDGETEEWRNEQTAIAEGMTVQDRDPLIGVDKSDRVSTGDTFHSFGTW